VPDGAHPCGVTAAPLDLSGLISLFHGGRHVEVETGARRSLEDHPGVGMLWKLLGAALFAQHKDALPALQRAAQLLPTDAECFTNLGNALRAGGRLEDAVASHRRAIELNRDYAEAHNNLGSALRDLRRAEEAVASYRKALAISPDFAMGHNNLGIVLESLGRHDEAAASHRRALIMRPDFPEAHGNLGNALRSMRRLEEAVASYQRGLAMKPDFAEALLNLSDTLLSLGRFEDAVTGYRRLLAIHPNITQAHNNLGNALRGLGRVSEAAAQYRRALELDPDVAEGHNNLGNALLDLGQLDEAVRSYQRALALNPRSMKAHSNLGSALRELGRLEEAEGSYQHALSLEPDSAEVLNNLAIVQRLQGRAAHAEASLTRAMAINPTAAATLTSLAELNADRGRFAEAEKLYRQAKSLEPNSAHAWAGIATLRNMNGHDDEWLAEARRLAAQRLRPRDEVNLQYAMGKYFDDVKDFENAFAHYRRANETAKTYRPPHDRTHLTATFDYITQIYDSAWVRGGQLSGSASTRPIFIVGMPRSGTSLAEQILASHPSVFGAGELSFWKTASVAVGSAVLQNQPTDALLKSSAADYLQLLAERSEDRERVVDKMPANFAHLGMIHAALPQARIIHMQRNPIDNCLSIYFQNFHLMHTYANDLDDLAHYYAEYLRIMRHWRSTLPQDVILDVPYEALVADQEVWSRKMVEFVGLPWDPACLDFHQTDRSVSTFSKWQVRQKISTASVERWRNYASLIGPLMRLSESDSSNADGLRFSGAEAPRAVHSSARS